MRRGPYVNFKRLLLIPSSSRVRIRTTRARARVPTSTVEPVKRPTSEPVNRSTLEPEAENTPIEEVDARLLAAITQTMRMHYVRGSKIKGERVRKMREEKEDVWERERKAREVRRERREVERVKEREREREKEREMEMEREREREKERVWLFKDDSDFTPIPVDLED